MSKPKKSVKTSKPVVKVQDMEAKKTPKGGGTKLKNLTFRMH